MISPRYEGKPNLHAGDRLFLLRLDKAEEHVGGARCALTFASGWIEMDDHPGRRHGCRMLRAGLPRASARPLSVC